MSAYFVFGCFAVAGFAGASAYKQVDEAQIQEVLRQMNTEEKFLQTCIDSQCPESRTRWLRCNPLGAGGMAGGGKAWFHLPDNERLGVRGMRMRDGPKGVTCHDPPGFGLPCPKDGKSPAFPSQITRAASWDVALEEEIGATIGEIAEMLDIHAALFPVINILPWLNWGRAQETYGEDPFFNGKMGAAAVRGVQKKGKVMATPKHFLANNIENTRWWVSAEFDDQTLHEVYLRAWAIVMAESSPELVMTSYNRVQGNWANADPRFLKILRERLGFDGSVMTDWFASWESIMSGALLGKNGSSSPFFGKKNFMRSNSLYIAGVDMEMPFCSKNREAISQIQVCSGDDKELCETSNAVDDVTERLLRSKSRYGLMGKSVNHTQPVTWDNARYDELILRSAQESIVMLKNDADLLPKKPSAVKSVVVLGSAKELELGDKGSSSVWPSGELVNVLEGLEEKYGKEKVTYLTLEEQESLAKIGKADLVVIDVGFNWTFEGEFLPPSTGGDRKYLTLHPWDVKLIESAASVSSKIVVAITAGSSVIVEDFVDKVQSVFWLGYPGPLGGRAFADIISGVVNPSGKMPTTTPRKAEDYLPRGINLQPWSLDPADTAPAYPYSHGFKHLWQEGVDPRYPFGWGLSYTSFTFEAVKTVIDEASYALKVGTDVSNTGSLAGAETVQVYASCRDCTQRRQPLLLVGFDKVKLAASESRHVEIAVDVKQMASYDMSIGMWRLEAGTYDVFVGPCADRRRLISAPVILMSEHVFDYPGNARLKRQTPIQRRDCAVHKCTPEDPARHIKVLSLPDDWPIDPGFLLLQAYQQPLLAAVIVGANLCLMLYCCCLYCCCRACQKKEKAA